MGIKRYKPVTPGRRGMMVSDFSELSKRENSPEKSLLESKRRISGRNNAGRITMRRRGGGAHRSYRTIDFKRDKLGVPATVQSIEYDPNRSANIALLFYADGEKRYILAPLGLKVGAVVQAGAEAEIAPGNAMPLDRIPLGTLVHNLEIKPSKGGQLIRSAGAAGQVMAREERYTLIRLPSGELRKVLNNCTATIGQVGNVDHENIHLGKAGRTRWLGRRPKVRGVVMNPVDHPMGGGEGKSSGGRHPCTPWGMPTKGYKTRRGPRPSDRLIVKRRTK